MLIWKTTKGLGASLLNNKMDKYKWICPKSDFEFSKGQLGLFQNMWWLNLASNEETPYDNKPIALTDTFFESVAIKNIEKQLYDLREIYYDKQE